MIFFTNSLFCALVFSIIFTGNLKALPPKTKTLKNNGGIAFTVPAAKWSGLKSDFYYHFTLTHIKTQNPKIVKLVRNAIDVFIVTSVPLNNGHRTISWIQPGIQKVNSLYFDGEASDFKLNLHNHLLLSPVIASYISPYRDAHVDVKGDFTKKLYNTFTADQIIERKTP